MGSMLANFEAANFAELLALLLERNVPFPGAIVLCAEASDDPRVVETCRALAAEVERGTRPRDALRGVRTLPPLLRWLLATGPEQGDLVAALRQMGSFYRRKALFQADKARILLPTMLLCLIGVSATLFYALTLFLPFSTLLEGIAQG
jgi:general secretion pathway protein F